MLSHYLKVAIRSIRGTPLTSAACVLTLSLGFACFLTAYAFVTFWSQAESSFPNSDRTYVLTTSIASRGGGFSSGVSTRSSELLAEYLRIDFPQLEGVARAVPIGSETIVSAEGVGDRLAAVAVDGEFLEIFDLPFARGDSRNALNEPRSVVLVEDYAARLYGGEDPLGRSVLIDQSVEATVTGVIREVPEPSHMGRSSAARLRFDMLTSMDVLEALRSADPARQPPHWLMTPALTYLLLPEDHSLHAKELVGALSAFVTRRVPDTILDTMSYALKVIPVRQLLVGDVDAALFPAVTQASVTGVLTTLALLVLAVAAVNAAGLATGKSIRRARELGLRMTLGASRMQITLQHLIEAAILTGAGLFLALAAFLIWRPALERLWGADLALALISSPKVWALVAAVAASVTFAAGIYPAILSSRLMPRKNAGILGRRSLPSRSAALLVGAQFAVAGFLGIVVCVVLMQNATLRRLGPAAHDDRIVLIENRSHLTGVPPEAVRESLGGIPGIESVTEVMGLPWAGLYVNLLGTAPAGPEVPAQRVAARYIGLDYFSVFGIELLAGRVFEPDRGDDVWGNDRPLNVVVDRELVRRFGLGTPPSAIGKTLYIGSQPIQVVGVVETNPFSLTVSEGMLYRLGVGPEHQIAVRIRRDDLSAAIERIDAAWASLAPGVAINRHFIDDLFGGAYAPFRRVGLAFGALGVIAMAVCAFGLLGMATLVAGRRMREIGVRKTLGATTRSMVLMLVANLTTPIVVANLIAWPAAWIAGQRYLDLFGSGVALSPLPFVSTLVATVLLAWAVVCGRVVRAARVRPADVLRLE